MQALEYAKDTKIVWFDSLHTSLKKGDSGVRNRLPKVAYIVMY